METEEEHYAYEFKHLTKEIHFETMYLGSQSGYK